MSEPLLPTLSPARSLRVKVALPIAVLLAITAVAAVVLVPTTLAGRAKSDARARALAVAAVLSHALAPAVEFDDPKGMSEALAGLDVANRAEGAETAPCVHAEVRMLDAPVATWPTEAANPAYAKVSRDVGVHEQAGLLVVTRAIGTSGAKLTLVLSLDPILAATRATRGAVAILALLVVVLGGAISSLVANLVVRDIRQLSEQAAVIVKTRDLSRPLSVRSNDESALLASSFGDLVGTLRHTLGSARELADGIGSVGSLITSASAGISRSGSDVEQRAEDTRGAVAGSQESLSELDRRVAALKSGSSQVRGAVREMTTSSGRLEAVTTSLVAAADETGAALERSVASSAEVSRSLQDQRTAVARTTAAADDLGAEARRIEHNALAAANLSVEAAQEATEGMRSLEELARGLDRMLESTTSAGHTVRDLGARLAEIGSVLDVLRELNDLASLLALNASITAAQAGNEGEPFAVVAREMKGLAARTATHTLRIEALVRDLLSLSERAGGAMASSVASVEEAHALGANTATAFRKIEATVARSAEAGPAIAGMTREQVRLCAAVQGSVQNIADTVDLIHGTSTAQLAAAQRVLESTRGLRALATELQSVAEVQQRVARQVDAGIADLDAVVSAVTVAQLEQRDAAEKVASAADRIRAVVASQRDVITELSSSADALTARARDLHGELTRFSL